MRPWIALPCEELCAGTYNLYGDNQTANRQERSRFGLANLAGKLCRLISSVHSQTPHLKSRLVKLCATRSLCPRVQTGRWRELRCKFCGKSSSGLFLLAALAVTVIRFSAMRAVPLWNRTASPRILACRRQGLTLLQVGSRERKSGQGPAGAKSGLSPVYPNRPLKSCVGPRSR